MKPLVARFYNFQLMLKAKLLSWGKMSDDNIIYSDLH